MCWQSDTLRSKRVCADEIEQTARLQILRRQFNGQWAKNSSRVQTASQSSLLSAQWTSEWNRWDRTAETHRWRICSMDLAYMCVKPQLRLYVCQALPLPNTKCIYMCVTKCVCMCVTKCVCMCVTKCVNMCVTKNVCWRNGARFARSFTFARFARTFFKCHGEVHDTHATSLVRTIRVCSRWGRVELYPRVAGHWRDSESSAIVEFASGTWWVGFAERHPLSTRGVLGQLGWFTPSNPWTTSWHCECY